MTNKAVTGLPSSIPSEGITLQITSSLRPKTPWSTVFPVDTRVPFTDHS